MDFEKKRLYPFLFVPAYKEVMWGGTSLKNKLHRVLPETSAPIGEAWDLYDRPEGCSIVENGPLAGTKLHDLTFQLKREFVGSSFQGEYFPLIVKIIDAAKRLSLQVHPSLADCRKLGKGEEKNEMWYILDAEPDASIFAGLSPMTTRMQFIDSIDSNDVENLLQTFDACPGDAYFIHAGRVHAIGAGIMLLEIQQNSDTTYRISDWGRTAPDGTSRPLHREEAMTCIDFTDRTVARITGACGKAAHNRKYSLISQCPFFRVENLKLVEPIYENTQSTESCHLISSVNCPVTVGNHLFRTDVPAGRTCLIPACFGRYDITPAVKDGETADVIRTSC